MSQDEEEIRMKAEDAHVTEYLKAQDLLAGIEEYLADLPAPTDEFRPDWGHVGDLKGINRLLEAIIAFVSGGMKKV
jgi:hypothetical protein